MAINYSVYLGAALTNAIENVTNGIFSISATGPMNSAKVNHLVSFSGTAVEGVDYTWYYSSSSDGNSGNIYIVPVDNAAWDASQSVTLTLKNFAVKEDY